MARDPYDVVTVGGGLGGATLARAMAERGARVLVLERERQFKDRVRGEWMAPWGAAEARALGIYDLLLETCAHALPAWDAFIGPMFLGRRVLAETTPQGLPALALYHPAMQEALLAAARDAGAEVRRLPDVDHLPAPVLQQVDARPGRHDAELLLERARGGGRGPAVGLRRGGLFFATHAIRL